MCYPIKMSMPKSKPVTPCSCCLHSLTQSVKKIIHDSTKKEKYLIRTEKKGGVLNSNGVCCIDTPMVTIVLLKGVKRLCLRAAFGPRALLAIRLLYSLPP